MVAAMTGQVDILLLAGSMEARGIGEAVAALGLRVHAVLTEPPKGPTPPPLPFDLMERPQAEGLAALAEGARAIVDASHGFDQQLTEAGQRAAAALGLPIINFSRPPWDAGENPLWQTAADVRSAMALVPSGARVFAATGWGSLPQCAAFPGDRLLLRQTHRHDRVPPFDFVELVFGEAPFTPESEAELFQALSVDLLMCRNLGGRASRPKLDAAAQLGLPVVLIDRPPLPEGLHTVQKTADVLDWVAAL